MPGNQALASGTQTFSVTLRTAGSQTLTASDITTPAKSQNTSVIPVTAGTFSKLQLLVPGETAAPGATSGKTGPASNEQGGTVFTVTVNAVDANWNLINTVTDTVGITSSDGSASLPVNAALSSGTQTFNVTLNTLGTQTLTASDITNIGKTANTSPSIRVTGPFVKLQLLVPGETAAPGPGSGKTGTPTAQGTGTAFTVTVNAVDTDWYVVSSTHTVGITSSDGSATLPANAALAGGTQTFSVTLNTPGPMTVTATDITDGTKTANTSPLFTVLARPIFDAASSAGGSATPLTWSHTVAAGSNGLLIVGVSTGDAVTTHNTVTYNTVPMTKISEVTGASDRVSIWTLVNPATGTKSVVVTLSAATNVKGGATSWTNVNQTTPVGTAATNTGSSNFPSVTVASAAEEVVHDTIGANADTDEGAVTADAGQTERWNIRTTHTGAGSTEVGAASVTMSWTMVKNTSWAIVGVPIKPAHVFTKLQLLVPGETAAPGTGSGKTGTPTARTAGTAFLVTVNAVDANWNVMSSTHTVGITSTDTNATLPANAALASGTQTFNVTLKTAGTKTLTATDITDGTKTANTSPLITVNPGVLNNFLVEAAGGGAIGTQAAGTAFNIRITARDVNNNTVTGFTGTATITSTGTLSAGGTTAAFASGVLTSHSVTISNTGSFTLTATSGSSGTSNAFTVNPGVLNNFLVEAAGGGEIGRAHV